MENFDQNSNYQQPVNWDNMNSNGMPVQQKDKPIWAAIVSFVLSLVNIVFCCCTTYIFAPVSLVLSIISLAKKWRGKGLAIAGIVISVITLLFMIVSDLMLRDVSDDMMKFVNSPDKYIQEYEETGEVPADFAKYNDEKYEKFFKFLGYNSFDEFFDEFMNSFIQGYEAAGGRSGSESSSGSIDDSSDSSGGSSGSRDESGEKPVSI